MNLHQERTETIKYMKKNINIIKANLFDYSTRFPHVFLLNYLTNSILSKNIQLNMCFLSIQKNWKNKLYRTICYKKYSFPLNCWFNNSIHSRVSKLIKMIRIILLSKFPSYPIRKTKTSGIEPNQRPACNGHLAIPNSEFWMNLPGVAFN